MAKTKKKKPTYRVLIACDNNATSKHYDVGDVVTDADFETAVIENWLACVPPVLEAE